MKPLNQAERNLAFTKYTVALVVTMLLFGVLFFVGSRIPEKEVEVLRKQHSEYRATLDKQAKMLLMMDSIEANLQLLDKPDANATYSETTISNLLIQLNGQLTDTLGMNVVYKKLAANYKRMMDDKAKIRNLSKDTEAGSDCSKELEKARAENMEYLKMLMAAGVAMQNKK